MKTNPLIAALALAFAGALIPAFGADTYQASLSAGDSARGAKNYTAALAAYQEATTQATTSTERALALAKQALVLAFDTKEYAKASDLAKESLSVQGTKPVARVEALRALAECQMKADEDYAAAIETLEEATSLSGVEWALPSLTLSLGDCYRFTGKNTHAIEVFQKIFEMPEAPKDIKAIAYLNTGCIYQYGLKDGDKAKEAYGKAVEFKPSLKGEIDEHLGRLP